jgi:hypothetical protein
MKTSSGTTRAPRKRVSPWLCALINQGAFPGLGTILSGRRIGYAQAAIMLAGFFLAMGFLIWYLVCAGRYAMNSNWSEAEFTSLYRPYKWSLRWGLGLCAVAWVWALFSSAAMLRGARAGAAPGESKKV